MLQHKRLFYLLFSNIQIYLYTTEFSFFFQIHQNKMVALGELLQCEILCSAGQVLMHFMYI